MRKRLWEVHRFSAGSFRSSCIIWVLVAPGRSRQPQEHPVKECSGLPAVPRTPFLLCQWIVTTVGSRCSLPLPTQGLDTPPPPSSDTSTFLSASQPVPVTYSAHTLNGGEERHISRKTQSWLQVIYNL